MKTLIVKKNHFGKGVYTNRPIAKGARICFMKGKIKKAYTLQLKGNAFRRAIVDPLQIGVNEYLDLEKPYIFINHSCNPNAGIRGKNELFALINIQTGEEITFDYSTTVDETFLCQCGARNCRRFIPVDFFGLPKTIQEYYIKSKAVPKYILKKYKKFYKEWMVK